MFTVFSPAVSIVRRKATLVRGSFYLVKRRANPADGALRSSECRLARELLPSFRGPVKNAEVIVRKSVR